ncbi:MAG: hypothetical protein M3520_04195 [Actinomycetota bacterium]|jgi:hypothetical protein|nr:hypothetical protein [Actinomycetota bacterium]
MSSQSSAASPDAQTAFRAVLRESMWPTLAAGALACLVLGWIGGLSSGISAVVGVVIAIGFFASGLVVVARFVTDNNPLLFMAVGMSVYFGQVLALFGVLLVARQVQVLDMRAAGIAMLVAVLVWQIAQMRAWRRARVPVYDLPADNRTADHPGPGGNR